LPSVKQSLPLATPSTNSSPLVHRNKESHAPKDGGFISFHLLELFTELMLLNRLSLWCMFGDFAKEVTKTPFHPKVKRRREIMKLTWRAQSCLHPPRWCRCFSGSVHRS